MTAPRSAHPCVSVPPALLSAYKAARATPAGAGLLPLSTMLQEAMRDALCRAGVQQPPPTTTPPRTAAATRARWQRKDGPQ